MPTNINEALYKLLAVVIKYVLGPVVAFVIAKSYTDDNHQKSAKAYEVVAESINDHVIRQLDDHEHRLDVIEKTPASQPAVVAPVIAPRPVIERPRPPAARSAKAPPPPPVAKAPQLGRPEAPPPPRPAPIQMQQMPSRVPRLPARLE